VQVADNGTDSELDDGSVRACHVRSDESHPMLAYRVSEHRCSTSILLVIVFMASCIWLNICL